MTFSSKVKNEILNSNIAVGNELSMLCGIILSAGTIVISNKQMSFNVISENYSLLLYTKKLIEKMFPQAIVVLPALKKSSKQRTMLNVDIASAQGILFELGILERDAFGRVSISLVGDSHLTIEREAKLAYLAGTFLGGGSISVPQDKPSTSKGGYHMEWSFNSSNQAHTICSILAEEDIFAKMVERGENYIAYIKGGEKISTAIALMGASNSYLSLESQIVDRQMRNLVNRQSNCISANIDKAVSAGLKQLDAINAIQSTIGLDGLPASLKEIAQIRLANPEATLSDLVEIMGNTITKSAINLRLRKIVQIANELGDTND